VILQIIGMLALVLIGLILVLGGLGLLYACSSLGAGWSDRIVAIVQICIGSALFYFAFKLSPFSIQLAQP
jgi:hypothetical protein